MPLLRKVMAPVFGPTKAELWAQPIREMATELMSFANVTVELFDGIGPNASLPRLQEHPSAVNAADSGLEP